MTIDDDASGSGGGAGSEVAVVHGGAVRGNKVYESGLVTFGDLQVCALPSH